MSLAIPAGATGLLLLGYAATGALLLALLFALLLIPSLLPSGARPEAAAKALYAFLLEGIGVALMTGSGLPAFIGVLSGIAFPRQSYLVLLIVFAVGGLLFLWNEGRQHSVDPVSRAVPALLFHYTLKLVGLVAMLLSAFALLVTLLFPPASLPSAWWISSLVILFYGAFLSWCARAVPTVRSFQSAPMVMKAAVEAKAAPKVVGKRKK